MGVSAFVLNGYRDVVYLASTKPFSRISWNLYGLHPDRPLDRNLCVDVKSVLPPPPVSPNPLSIYSMCATYRFKCLGGGVEGSALLLREQNRNYLIDYCKSDFG